MPKRTSDVPTTKSESEIVQLIDACLTKQGFHRSGPKNKFVWRRGLYWTIFVSTRVTEGIAHFEVWNFVPLPGLGSFLIYFFNMGQLDAILEEVQKAGLSGVVPASLDDTGTQSQVITEPPKKTVTGFAKAWTIFWIVGNLAAACAPSYRLSDSTLGGVVAMVMLLSAAVAVGYILLLYRKPIGLYLILLANLLALFLNNSRVGNYSINVTTGLIIGILTFFITRKQVAYPFGRLPVAPGKVDDAKEREVALLQTPGKTANEAQPPMPAGETAPPPVTPESLAAGPAPLMPASSSSAPQRAATAEHPAASRNKRNKHILVLAVGVLAACVLLLICLVAGITQLNLAMSNTFSNINAGLNPLQPKPEINTTVGALVISKTEFASSLPPGCSPAPACNQAGEPGRQFLILWLERKDSGKMKDIKDGLLNEVRDNPGKAYVTTSDGYRAELAKVFFEDPRFALGFVVPVGTSGGITLNWPNNPIIALGSPLGGSSTTSSPAFTGRITPAPPPTTTPIVRSGLAQPGHWEGSPSVSFEVTADGKIRNFRLVGSMPMGTCTITIDTIEVDETGKFELGRADNSPMHLTGEFASPKILGGTYKIKLCRGAGDQVTLVVQPKDETWKAEWKGTTTPTSTLNVTFAPTKAAPTPTSTPTRISPTAARILPMTELSEAIAKGRVKFTIFGNGLESINVTLELTDEEPLEVTIPPGTIFQATSGGVQSMVVRQPRTVALMSRGTKLTVEVQVACSSMHLDQPTSSDTFTIRRISTDPDLLTLLTLPEFQMESFRVQQFAIWTITDNPPRNGYVGLGTSYSLYGSGPSTDEFQRILALFDKAGISTSKYQALRSLILPTLSFMQPTTAPASRSPTATLAPMVTSAATALPAVGLHCDNPNAQITSPGMNQKIRGIVLFVGGASIPDFLYYKIQFMPEASYGTDQWGQLYQAKTPVPATGKLMEWHTYTVEPGAYWLRLIVADRTGNYPDPCEIRVQVER